jgi:hypothetical protein
MKFFGPSDAIESLLMGNPAYVIFHAGTLHHIKTLVSEGYHPKIDNSPLCTEEDSAKYRSMIGCCILMIVLVRFDIVYASSDMIRISMLPRKGNLKAAKRVLLYLKTFPKRRIIFDTTYPDHSVYPIEDRLNWREFYPDSEEEIPNDLPTS